MSEQHVISGLRANHKQLKIQFDKIETENKNLKEQIQKLEEERDILLRRIKAWDEKGFCPIHFYLRSK